MDEKKLIKKENRFAIPFWYGKDKDGLFFRIFKDERFIPTKFKNNVIDIEIELYYKKRDDGFESLDKEITVYFFDSWTPKFISPQNPSFSKLRPIIVPKFKYIYNYQSKEAINHPEDVFTGNRYDEDFRMLVLTGEDYSDVYEKNTYRQNPYEITLYCLKEFDCLEFTICIMLLLTAYPSSIFCSSSIETMLEMLNGGGLVSSSGQSDISTTIDMFQTAISTYPYFPKKYLYPLNQYLKYYLWESYELKCKIESFLDYQGFSEEDFLYEEDEDIEDNVEEEYDCGECDSTLLLE